MNRLKALERRLLAAEKWSLVAIIVVMVVLSFTQVVLRGLFKTGILWADTFLRHLVLWVGFLGASIAASENKQFAMDASVRVFKGRLRAGVGLIIGLFTAVVCLILADASLTFFRQEYADWAADHMRGILFDAGGVHVPGWIFEIILPAGFALLAAHYLLKIIFDCANLLHPPADEDAKN